MLDSKIAGASELVIGPEMFNIKIIDTELNFQIRQCKKKQPFKASTYLFSPWRSAKKKQPLKVSGLLNNDSG